MARKENRNTKADQAYRDKYRKKKQKTKKYARPSENYNAKLMRAHRAGKIKPGDDASHKGGRVVSESRSANRKRGGRKGGKAKSRKA